MKQSTADVLDESKRLEDIIDWQLFTMEQDAMLWGGREAFENGPREWMPGDPLHEFWYDPLEDRTYASGNHVRDMVEIFDDVPLNQEYWGPDGIYYRCQDDGVGWRGDEGCFVCGRWQGKTDIWWDLRERLWFETSRKVDRPFYQVDPPTDEEVDAALEALTERIEEARRKRQEARRAQVAAYSKAAMRVSVSFEAFGHAARDATQQIGEAFNRWTLVMPRQHAPASMLGALVGEVDEWTKPRIVSYGSQPPTSAIKKTPFKLPEFLVYYDRLAPNPWHYVQPRFSLRVKLSEYAYGQVPKFALHIPPPVISRGNPHLEEWLTRQERQNTNQRRANEVRDIRGRSNAGPRRVRHGRQG